MDQSKAGSSVPGCGPRDEQRENGPDQGAQTEANGLDDGHSGQIPWETHEKKKKKKKKKMNKKSTKN